jgi:hypothetical protein
MNNQKDTNAVAVAVAEAAIDSAAEAEVGDGLAPALAPDARWMVSAAAAGSDDIAPDLGTLRRMILLVELTPRKVVQRRCPVCQSLRYKDAAAAAAADDADAGGEGG